MSTTTPWSLYALHKIYMHYYIALKLKTKLLLSFLSNTLHLFFYVSVRIRVFFSLCHWRYIFPKHLFLLFFFFIFIGIYIYVLHFIIIWLLIVCDHFITSVQNNIWSFVIDVCRFHIPLTFFILNMYLVFYRNSIELNSIAPSSRHFPFKENGKNITYSIINVFHVFV